MNKFEPMVRHIEPGKQGVAEVRHVNVSEEDSKFTALRAAVKRDRGAYVPPGDYVQLFVKGQLMMSDTQMEQTTNREILEVANGGVLIAGLGVAMVLLPVLQNPKVRSVTVVEKYQDVIDLVTIQSPKLTMVCADIFEWLPVKGTKFDTIYFDIWPEITLDNLKEMETLHKRFRKFKSADGWMESWMRKDLIRKSRRELSYY